MNQGVLAIERTVDAVARYTWIVTRDAVLGDSSDAVGRIGPHGVQGRAPFDRVIRDGAHFRLLDEAGQSQFSGYILGDFQGNEPLDDFGRANGCVGIEYEADGGWVEAAKELSPPAASRTAPRSLLSRSSRP